ncbi:MAG: acyl-CoA dehydrogenase, partial [Actinophytocola sp.]|nr:acyl-CoA dehydrogenase [Actinophytocola sp.]
MSGEGTPAVDEREARRVAEAARDTQWRAPSFAKELYLGRFRLDLIHPHPRQEPADQERGEAFLAKLRDLCDNELDGTVIERDAKIPDEQVQALARLGAFGMKIPEEYGGLGLSQLTYNRALMLVGAVHASFVALLSAHQSIGVPQPVKLFGTEEQKRAYLPRCAQGAISAFLLT